MPRALQVGPLRQRPENTRSSWRALHKRRRSFGVSYVTVLTIMHHAKNSLDSCSRYHLKRKHREGIRSFLRETPSSPVRVKKCVGRMGSRCLLSRLVNATFPDPGLLYVLRSQFHLRQLPINIYMTFPSMYTESDTISRVPSWQRCAWNWAYISQQMER